MAAMGLRMAAAGRLAGGAVVATVMSNLGLELALRSKGARLVRTEVGDPAVAREMRTDGYNLGGEQSGHVIFMDHSTTGDGIITALMMLTLMVETGRPLSELRAMHRVPQVMENVRVAARVPLAEMPDVQRTDRRRRKALGRQRPPVGALLGHRDAGARDDRGRRPGRDRRARARDRRRDRPARRPRARPETMPDGSASISITSPRCARRGASTIPIRSRRRSPPSAPAPARSPSICAKTAGISRTAISCACARRSTSVSTRSWPR